MASIIEKRINILNVSIDNLSMVDLLSQLINGGVVFTPNIDHLRKLQHNSEFHQVYHAATYRVCDSQVLLYASRLLGSPLRERVSGSDLFPAFCEYYHKNKSIKIFLLGSSEGVAEQAQRKINSQYDRELVVGCYSPTMGLEVDDLECQYIVDLINESGATALAVGLGAPKQELWIHRYKKELTNVKIFLAVGAAIDFAAGHQKRAPAWISSLGMEWFYRMYREPHRLWKRYLIDDLPVLGLILLQRLNIYRSPFPTLSSIAPIGYLLKAAGLLSEEQVNSVLSTQKESRHLRFGEIVAKHQWLREETVNFFVDSFPKSLSKMGKKRLPLGYYLRMSKLLDRQQIKAILDEQKKSNKLFGEIAVGKNWIKQETIDFFLLYLRENLAE